MKKKLLSLFMACAMILALAVPAFADNYNVNEEGNVSEDLTQTVTIATRTFVPTVRLTLPTLTEPSVVLNPYKISFTGDDAVVNGQTLAVASGSTTNPDEAKQVISPVYFIKNETNVKLNYTVAVTGTVEGGVTFSNDAVSLTEKNKKAHVALMVANKGVAPESNADPSLATTAEQDILAASIGLTKADIDTQYLKTTEVKFTQPKSLDAASTSAANYVAFQFKGDLTRQPTPNAWTADDKVGAVITFTFTPESAQDYANTTAVALTYTQTASGDTAADLAVTTDKTTWAGIMTAAGIAAADVNTTPEWKVENEGLYGAKLFTPTSATSPSGITFAAAKLDAVTAAAGGTAYNDTVILSFKDADGIPRTVALKVTITVSPAS